MKQKDVLGRWLKIILVFSRYFIFYKIGRHRQENFGKRLRLACEELGPIFIKLGQILSTRYDILNDQDSAELQKLLDQVEPLSWETVALAIKLNFGRDHAHIFETFEKKPIASASMAQVHRATLPSGEKVAVKVLRPNIRGNVDSDITVLRQVIRLGQIFSPDLRHIGAVDIVAELRNWMLMEMDFRQEVKNLERMRSYLAYAIEYTKTSREEAESLVIPKAYPELCTDNIIVMEFIEGIPLSRFDNIKNDPEYDLFKSAKTVARFYLRHFLVSRDDEYVFHADPHPANMLILPHGKIALIDFGLIGSLSPRETRQIADLFLAIYAGNLEQSIEYALALTGVDRETYVNILRPDIRVYLYRTPNEGIGFWLMGFVKIFLKHRVPIPNNLILFSRQNAVIDGLIGTLLPGKSTRDIMGEELERGLRHRIIQNLADTDYARLAYAISEEIKETPEKVAAFIGEFVKDPLKVVRDFREALR